MKMFLYWIMLLMALMGFFVPMSALMQNNNGEILPQKSPAIHRVKRGSGYSTGNIQDLPEDLLNSRTHIIPGKQTEPFEDQFGSVDAISQPIDEDTVLAPPPSTIPVRGKLRRTKADHGLVGRFQDNVDGDKVLAAQEKANLRRSNARIATAGGSAERRQLKPIENETSKGVAATSKLKKRTPGDPDQSKLRSPREKIHERQDAERSEDPSRQNAPTRKLQKSRDGLKVPEKTNFRTPMSREQPIVDVAGSLEKVENPPKVTGNHKRRNLPNSGSRFVEEDME
ncbi:hypothetical protein Ddc_14644 [Ditylenchus destructor]|nr:hypothetical protein Ddc_14644 [Ditylenchus destructor]